MFFQVLKDNCTRNFEKIAHYRSVGITYHSETTKQSRIEEVIQSVQSTRMVAQKSSPSFASILTILSIVMYTGGFLRIEVDFNKQKDKINELEKVVESMKTSNSDNIAQGKLDGEIKKAIDGELKLSQRVRGHSVTLILWHATRWLQF